MRIHEQEDPLVCSIVTIGEKGIHDQWRICSHCKKSIEDFPDECPNCGARIWSFKDVYIRHRRINMD